MIEKRLGAGFALAVFVFVTFGGCDTPPSPYDEVEWQCHSDGESCGCRGTNDPASVVDRRPRVISCERELPCCFVKTLGEDSFECTCVAVEAGAASGAGGQGGEGSGEGGAGGEDPRLACVREAVAHGTSEVVARCPPIELNDSAVCALHGESCDRDYLNQNGLVACCNGTSCQRDSRGQEICL
jgi:hypothetical protein